MLTWIFNLRESVWNRKTSYYDEPLFILPKGISIVPKDSGFVVEIAVKMNKKIYSETSKIMTKLNHETIRQCNEYISVSEAAIVAFYKAPYPFIYIYMLLYKNNISYIWHNFSKSHLKLAIFQD